MSTYDRNKSTRQNRLRQITAGVQKHFANGPLQLGGRTFASSADFIALLTNDIAVSDAADKAHADFREKIDAQKASRAALAPLLKYLRQQVVGLHSDSPSAAGTLADFGFLPRAVKPQTVASKAAAAAKREATRKARHVMGKVQRKAITGAAPPAPAPEPPGPAPDATAPTSTDATAAPPPARSTTTTTTST